LRLFFQLLDFFLDFGFLYCIALSWHDISLLLKSVGRMVGP